ncbi:MAG: acetate--CoA ligase [bacterium]|nr:acetate--CoA ligase [bacterium]
MKKTDNVIKKGDLYYPGEEFKKKALVSDASVYKKALEDPVKFWEKLAEELVWTKKWDQGFVHKPPHFEWFVGGELNITENALDENLKKRKDKIALIWEPEPTDQKQKTFTFGELYQEVNKFANCLKKLDVKKGDRVGIYLPMIPEAIIAMLGCARIGAVHAVVFSAFSPKALQLRLQDTEAEILITADGYFRRGEIVNLKQNADAALSDENTSQNDREKRGTSVKKVVVVKRAGNEVRMQSGRDLWWDDLVGKESDECQPVPVGSEDLLFILYTSGSTGKPKGCCHVAGGYAVQAKFTAKWIFDFKENDIFWSTADVGWITGHTYSCYGPLLSGTTVVIYEGSPDWPSPERWCQIIEKYGITTFYTAPTAIRMFKKYGTDLVRKYKLATLRLIGSVGEPIDETAWDWYFNEVGKGNCLLLDTWWQTETGGILITSLPGIGPFKPSFAGLPFPGVKVDILGEDGKSLPAGKEGDLVVLPPFSPGLLRNIYKNPKKYLETYWSKFGSKVYLTSDGAYKDENGLVRILGRVDDVIKVAGHRLSTGEMESVIEKHPNIAESAVIGIPDEIKGEVPVAFIVVKNTNKPADDIKTEIINLLRKEIGPFSSLKTVYLVKDLPKTRSGKIMRRVLRKLLGGEELGDLSTLANPECVEEIKKVV